MAVSRPPIKWSTAEVDLFKKLCGIFCTKAEVCSVMGIKDHRTLDRLIADNFPETPTWEEAFAALSGTGRASLRRMQFEAAMSGNTAMLIFLGKNYLGQTDQGARQEEDKDTSSRLAVMIQGSKFAKAANA